MKTIRLVFIASLATAALLALLGCALSGNWQFGIVFVVLCGGWWLQQQRGMAWHSVFFIVYMGALALVGTLSVGAGWLLSAAVAVLVSWDLNLLLQEAGAGNLVNESLLVQDHLRALGRVIVLSLLLGGTVLLIRIRLSFWIAFVLALVVILALNSMMRQVVDE
jgi:hypothetical protein